MAPSSRDRISVDLHGMKAVLLERSRLVGQTPSDLVRAALAASLSVSGPQTAAAPQSAKPLRPRVRLSLRMLREEADMVVQRANAAGLPPGTYVAGVCASVAPVPDGERPADRAAALVRSCAELSTLARDLRHLTQLLRQGNVPAAQQYRVRLDDVEREVRAHIDVAAAVASELKPLLRQGRPMPADSAWREA